MDRREFARYAFGAVLTGSLLTLLTESGCSPAQTDTSLGPVLPAPTGLAPLTVDLNDPRYTALQKVGGAVKIPVSGQAPLIVSRVDETTYAAFTSRCTHQGCQLPLPNSRGVITCPCHGAQFDQAGRLLRGPARRDLPIVPLTQAGAVLSLSVDGATG